MNRAKQIVSGLVLAALSALSATASGQHSAGVTADSLYNKEEYRGAVEAYRQSLAEEGVSADTYYNLGNAYYRLGQSGRAVVSYERALKLNPTHEDARTNLAFVNSRIADLPEDDSAFLSNLQRNIMNAFTPNAWAVGALVLFLLLAGAVALYIFAQDVVLRKCGFFGGFAILVFFIYALVTAITAAASAKNHDEAVVIVPTTFLSPTPRPGKSAQDKLVAIHEGTKVEIIDSLSTPDDPESPKWLNVKINNSSKAWLKSIDVERI